MTALLVKSVTALSLLLAGLAAGGDLKVGDNAKVLIRDLGPTQFTVGMKEVESRQHAIALEKARGEDALKQYLKSKRKIAAIGPGGRLYLVDGHHLAMALDRSGIDSIYVEIVADYSDLSVTDFWIKMGKKGYAHLKDEKGLTRLPSELPGDIRALKNDPYRSLAWMLETLGAFEKIERPFHEFEWAELLRQNMRIRGDSPTDWRQAVETGWKVATSKKAKELPGYLGKHADSCYFSWKKLGIVPPG